MAISSYKFGPGVFTIGAGPLDISAQVTKGVVKWTESVDTTDAINTLDGSQIPEEEAASYKAQIDLTVLQDSLAAGAMVDYTWTNKGSNVAFKFIPANANNRKITGTLRVMPIDVGGDEFGKRPTSDVTFQIIGTPVLGATP